MRVSGTSRKADRVMTQEMYYESEGRSYDTVIRKDLNVSEEDIEKLCSDMKAVALAFSYMNLIEGWGTGIPRLLREIKEYGLPDPEFVDMEIALRINLYRVADLVQSSAELISESALKVHENEKVRSKCA